MPAKQPDRIEGAFDYVLRLDEVTALKNPEWLSRGDWSFRVWINGVERWRSEDVVHVGRGKTAPVGAEIPIEIDDNLDLLELRVEATEHDVLTPDEHARGEQRLYRTDGFGRRGFTCEVTGDGAHLELHGSGEVRAAG